MVDPTPALPAEAQAWLTGYRDGLHGEPTPAEIEAGAAAFAAHFAVPVQAHHRDATEVVLRAVLPDHDARVRAPLLDLIADFLDPDPCRYDHDDLCQAHGLDRRPCMHGRAKQLLAKYTKERPDA